MILNILPLAEKNNRSIALLERAAACTTRLLLPPDYFELPLLSNDTVVIYPLVKITSAKALWASHCPPEGEGSTE